jgi:hypothetical protein
MTTKSTSKSNVKLLKQAKADFAAGEASFRSAANRIAEAISCGATQAEAAKLVGKSQPWISRLLKWRTDGFKGGPFEHPDHFITQGNNPAKEIALTVTKEEPKKKYVTVEVITRNQKLVAPTFTTPDGDEGAGSEPERSEEEEVGGVGAGSMPETPLGKASAITMSPASKRKMVARTMEYLKTIFGGDAAAMWQALDEYRSAEEKGAAVDDAHHRESALH